MAFIRAAILYAPPEKSTELIKSNCRYGTWQPRHETVLHNNSNHKTNKLQNIATQLFVQNIILLKYYARWKYLESFCFFFIVVVEDGEGTSAICNGAGCRYAIAFQIMRQNWPTGTCVEYDLWAIELVLEANCALEMACCEQSGDLSSQHIMGAVYHGVINCAYVPYSYCMHYCWRYLLPIFVFLILRLNFFGFDRFVRPI